MIEALAAIIAIAVLGSLSVPTTMLLLARFGYFEPIVIDLFGRRWRFAPRIRTASANSTAATVVFSSSTASAAMPAALILVANLQVGMPRDVAMRTLNSQSGMSVTDSTAFTAVVG